MSARAGSTREGTTPIGDTIDADDARRLLFDYQVATNPEVKANYFIAHNAEGCPGESDSKIFCEFFRERAGEDLRVARTAVNAALLKADDGDKVYTMQELDAARDLIAKEYDTLRQLVRGTPCQLDGKPLAPGVVNLITSDRAVKCLEDYLAGLSQPMASPAR